VLKASYIIRIFYTEGRAGIRLSSQYTEQTLRSQELFLWSAFPPAETDVQNCIMDKCAVLSHFQGLIYFSPKHYNNNWLEPQKKERLFFAVCMSPVLHSHLRMSINVEVTKVRDDDEEMWCEFLSLFLLFVSQLWGSYCMNQHFITFVMSGSSEVRKERYSKPEHKKMALNYVKSFHVNLRIYILCWIGEFLVDPVLPFEPYFSRSSANSRLHNDKRGNNNNAIN